jgi:hypothetical protein
MVRVFFYGIFFTHTCVTTINLVIFGAPNSNKLFPMRTATQVLANVYTAAQCTDANDARIALEHIYQHASADEQALPSVLRRVIALRKQLAKFEPEAFMSAQEITAAKSLAPKRKIGAACFGTQTKPAAFTFVYADLVPVLPNKLRLFNKSTTYAFDLPLQYIKACRLSVGCVSERRPDGSLYKHSNAPEHPIALIGGNMLDADKAVFFVAFFGVSYGGMTAGSGSGIRYRKFTGLDAAERAVERWAKKKFRVSPEA